MRLVVILAYLAALLVIWFPPKGLLFSEEPERPPFWRDVRFWAGVVIFAQIAVYAVFG